MEQKRRRIPSGKRSCIGVGVAAIVQNKSGKVALLRRLCRAGKGLWGLPGGRVRVGELLKDAVLREVAEELGVRGSIVGDLGWMEDISDEGHWLSALFVVGNLVGTPYNREPNIHSHLKWFTLDGVPEDLMLVAKTAIARFANNPGNSV